MRFITDNQDDSKKEVIMKQCLFTLISILMVMTSCSNRKTPVDSNTHDFPTYNTTRESAKTDSVIKDVSNMEPVNTKSSSYSSSRKEKELDNMRGFDPASEDDMDDNGMQRYFDANDDEAWD